MNGYAQFAKANVREINIFVLFAKINVLEKFLGGHEN